MGVTLRFVINIYLVLSHFWHRAPKTLGISCDERDKDVSYVNEVTFGPT